MSYENLSIDRKGNIFIITLQRPPENRFTSAFAQELTRAFHSIQKELGPDAEGAVITRGSDTKFYSTGLALDERDTNPFASTDGFYPVSSPFSHQDRQQCSCVLGLICVTAPPHNPRLPLPHHRPDNRPRLRRLLPPNPRPRLPSHEFPPGFLVHAAREPRSPFRRHRLPSSSQTRSSNRSQGHTRGA